MASEQSIIFEYGSIPQAAAMLGVCDKTMKAILANPRNGIRTYIPNKQKRVNLQDVQRYMQSRECGRKRINRAEPVLDFLSD